MNRIRARRDCPELILPRAASGVQQSPGNAWALSGFSTVATAAQWTGGILIGLLVEDGVLYQYIPSTAGLSTNLVRVGQAQLFADIGDGVGDLQIAQFPFACGGFANHSGWVNDAMTIVAGGFDGTRIPLSHRYFPSGTLFRMKSAEADSYGGLNTLGVKMYAYAPESYNLFDVPAEETWDYGGAGPVVRQTTVWPSMATATLAMNTWVEIAPVLDADYLIDGVVLAHNTNVGSFDVDLGVCGATGSPTTVQARACMNRQTIFGTANAHVEKFFDPFIAYKGERVMGYQTFEQNAGVAPLAMVWGRKL